MPDDIKVVDAFAYIAAGTKATIDIDIDMEDEGVRYCGKFVFRKPSIMDQIKRSVCEAKLRDGADPKTFDNLSTFIINAYSMVQVLCENHPSWAKDITILPSSVVVTIYNQWLEKANFFRGNDIGGDGKEDS
jgi:hypothetical protein